MTELPASELSYWAESISKSNFPELVSDARVNVAIVGGGITGLTTAYLLAKAGKRVAVIEKDILASGTTGHTTGKVSSQHGLIYNKLASKLGEETARIYGQSNQAALEEIARIIKVENIECDWQRDDNYVFTEKNSQVQKFQKEAEIAEKLGLPATFETTTGLPFEVKGAVKFANQAKFHSAKYTAGLAKAIYDLGGEIFEHTKAIGIRRGRHGLRVVMTSHGNIHADDAVIATNVPFFPLIARGAYCALEYPLKSYIVAGKNTSGLKGMYINVGSPLRSILPIKSGNDDMLLIGGESHIPGKTFNTKSHHKRLAHYADKRLGLEQVEYRWSARDYLGYDSMPLVGRLYPWTKNLYVATGFMKWGLTNATVAAAIISDSILGHENPATKVFNSNRLSPITSFPSVVAKHMGLSN